MPPPPHTHMATHMLTHGFGSRFEGKLNFTLDEPENTWLSKNLAAPTAAKLPAKTAKLPPTGEGASQRILVQSGEHVWEFSVQWSRFKKFHRDPANKLSIFTIPGHESRACNVLHVLEHAVVLSLCEICALCFPCIPRSVHGDGPSRGRGGLEEVSLGHCSSGGCRRTVGFATCCHMPDCLSDYTSSTSASSTNVSSI